MKRPFPLNSVELGPLRRAILSMDRPPDPYLSSVARRFPSHAFLGSSTQGVYQRHVLLLREVSRKLLGQGPSKTRVLDWGCGKGHITYLLKAQGFQVTSCDRRVISDDSAFGQETPILKEKRIKVLPLDREVDLPFQDRSFDSVVSFGVLEHVKDDIGSLREIHRILRPGGILFVTFLPYLISWTQQVAHLIGNDYHDRLYSVRKVRALAEGSGFSVLDLWHGQFFPKNSMPISNGIERLDRFLTDHTPLRFLATNLEAVMERPRE